MPGMLDRSVTPSASDRALAAAAAARVSADSAPRTAGPVRFRLESDAGGEALVVPAAAFELFARILAEMAKGNAVTVMPVDAELTTQEAADMIGVSRPFLIARLEAGEIPFRKVGTHRRVNYLDLMAYKQRIDRERMEVLAELTAEAQELGMGY